MLLYLIFATRHPCTKSKLRRIARPGQPSYVDVRGAIVFTYYSRTAEAQYAVVQNNPVALAGMKALTAASAAALLLRCGIPHTRAFTPALPLVSRCPPRPTSAVRSVRPRVSMVSISPAPTVGRESVPVAIDLDGVNVSGLNGLALQPKTFPTKRDVMKVIPPHCFKKDTLRSMKYAVISCAITLSMGFAAAAVLPLKVGLRHGVSPTWSLVSTAVTDVCAFSSASVLMCVRGCID